MLNSFKARLTLSMISLIVFAIIIVSLISNIFIYNNIISISEDYNGQLATQICSNMGIFLSSIVAETNSASTPPNLQYYGKYFLTETTQPNTDKLKTVLWKAMMQQNAIDDISIMLNGQKIVCLFNMYDPETLSKVCSFYKKQYIYVNAQFVPEIVYNRNGKPSLSCVKAIQNTKNVDYYISSNVTLDKIFELISNINIRQDSGTCIVDNLKHVEYTSNTDINFAKDMNNLIKTRTILADSNFISSIDNKKYILSFKRLQSPDISVIVYTPLSIATQSTNLVQKTILLVVGITLLIAIFLGVKLSNLLTAPILKLTGYIGAMGGKLAPIPRSSGTKETDMLYDKFNEMVEKIEVLLTQIGEENQLKRRAELHALQAQINPHFLYNTLDSINAMAILNDNYMISDMTTSLGHLLRLSVDQEGEFISIEDEVNHVKAYLAIQQVRYNDKFFAEFDIEPEIIKCTVVKLILQPLVENSIYHGIELKNGKGKIKIKIYPDSLNIKIEITDDGIGMEPGMLTQINKALDKGVKPQNHRSIGIYNVNERIKLYYGSEYGITFTSTLGIGTTAVVTIPKKE